MTLVPRFFADYQERIDDELRRRVSVAAGDRVQEAMAYTLLAPSKRIRPGPPVKALWGGCPAH